MLPFFLECEMYAFYRHEPIHLVIEHDGTTISMVKIIPEEKYWQHQALELSDKYTNKIKEVLDAYFAGKNRLDELTCQLDGTDFELSVWDKTKEIPFGSTATYADIAKAVGNPDAARAVGNALNKNPLLLIIPCHRIIGSDGEMHGFGGGVENKKWLLEHEAKNSGK
jgi:methylated-DNA-[protein]-cysteine S-methyltransferase